MTTTAAPSSQTETYPSGRYGWYVVAVLVLAYMVSYIDRTMLSLLVDPIRHSLDITDFQISLLHGLAFVLFYTVLGVPIGQYADRRNRRNLIMFGIAFWSLMAALCGVARSFGQMFLARIGVGIGEATLAPAGYSILSDYFPPEKRPRALAVLTSGIYLGAGAATFGGGALIAIVPAITVPLIGRMEPWQVIFLLTGLIGLPFAALILTIREPKRMGMSSKIGHGKVTLRETFRYIWQGRGAFLLVTFGTAAISMMTNGVRGWIPTFLMRTYHLTPATVGLDYGLVLLIFGTIGTAGGGFFSVWLRRRGHPDANVKCCILAAALALPFGIAAPLVATPNLSLMLYGVVIFFGGFPFGVSAAAIQDITPNQMRGQIAALYLFAINFAGIGTGPMVIALFTDKVFHDDLALRYSLVCIMLLTIPLALVMLIAGLKPYRRALARGVY